MGPALACRQSCSAGRDLAENHLIRSDAFASQVVSNSVPESEIGRRTARTTEAVGKIDRSLLNDGGSIAIAIVARVARLTKTLVRLKRVTITSAYFRLPAAGSASHVPER